MKRLAMAALGSAWLALSSVGAAWETAGFYSIKGKLIRPGMTMDDVRRDAGDPLERLRPVPGGMKPINDKPATHQTAKGKSKGPPKAEVWRYRGSDGVYSLVFGGGRLSRIDVTPARGS